LSISVRNTHVPVYTHMCICVYPCTCTHMCKCMHMPINVLQIRFYFVFLYLCTKCTYIRYEKSTFKFFNKYVHICITFCQFNFICFPCVSTFSATVIYSLPVFFWGGGQRLLVPLLLLGPPFFPIILFGSTTLLTRMTGISLHMQWLLLQAFSPNHKKTGQGLWLPRYVHQSVSSRAFFNILLHRNILLFFLCI
jgi:hypothetical protein